MRYRLLPYMWIKSDVLSERYFERREPSTLFEYQKFVDFSPYHIEIWCHRGGRELKSYLALLGRGIRSLCIARDRKSKIEFDLSFVNELPNLTNLVLEGLNVRGEIPSHREINIFCDRCHISPRANLGRGNIGIRMNQDRLFRWEPVRLAKIIKIEAAAGSRVCTSPYGYIPNPNFLSPYIPMDIEVRDLVIDGVDFCPPLVYSLIEMTHLKNLSFPHSYMFDRPFFIWGGKSLERISLESETYEIDKAFSEDCGNGEKRVEVIINKNSLYAKFRPKDLPLGEEVHLVWHDQVFYRQTPLEAVAGMEEVK